MYILYNSSEQFQKAPSVFVYRVLVYGSVQRCTGLGHTGGWT